MWLAFMLLLPHAGADFPKMDSGFGSTRGAKTICLSPDGRKFAVTGYMLGGHWGVWDLKQAKRIAIGEMKVVGAQDAVFSADGKRLIVGGDVALFPGNVSRTELRILDAESGKELGTLEGHRSSIRRLAVLPGGNRLVSLDSGNMIRVWNLERRKPLAKYCFTSRQGVWNMWKGCQDAEHEKAATAVIYKDVIENINDFAVHQDGKLMAVSTGTDTVYLMEVLTGKITKRLRCKKVTDSVGLAFSADGQWLAIGGGLENGGVEVWDVANDRVVHVLEKHAGSIAALAFSPNKELLASGSLGYGARVWDLRTGKEKYRLHHRGEDESFDSYVHAVAFLPGGSTLLTLCGGEPLRFWEATTGRPRARKKAVHDLRVAGTTGRGRRR